MVYELSQLKSIIIQLQDYVITAQSPASSQTLHSQKPIQAPNLWSPNSQISKPYHFTKNYRNQASTEWIKIFVPKYLSQEAKNEFIQNEIRKRNPYKYFPNH